MRVFLLASLAAAAIPMPVQTIAQDSQQRLEWNQPFEPFRVVGNVYYVGTRGLSAFLITGSKGHILIDGGLPESAPSIAANIQKLGFRLRDVKYLLINHAHADHAGGLAELKRLTGAQLVASQGDRTVLEAGRSAGRPELGSWPAVKVDRVVADHGVLRLGDIALSANLTPGHTKGCTSWSIQAAGKNVLFACSLTVAGQKLTGDRYYPTAVADFRRTFARLRTMKADVFLNFHPGIFDMEGKRARQIEGNANAFVDPGELARQVVRAERAFRDELRAQRAKGK